MSVRHIPHIFKSAKPSDPHIMRCWENSLVPAYNTGPHNETLADEYTVNRRNTSNIGTLNTMFRGAIHPVTEGSLCLEESIRTGYVRS